MKLFVLATVSVLAVGACSGSDDSVDGEVETSASTLDSAGEGAVPLSTPAEKTAGASGNAGPAPRFDSALPMLTPEPDFGYELAAGGRA